MKKLIFFVLTLLIAAFIANYFHIVSIPWLELPQVKSYTEKSIEHTDILKKLED